jgi:hypothetical protein
MENKGIIKGYLITREYFPNVIDVIFEFRGKYFSRSNEKITSLSEDDIKDFKKLTLYMPENNFREINLNQYGYALDHEKILIGDTKHIISELKIVLEKNNISDYLRDSIREFMFVNGNNY